MKKLVCYCCFLLIFLSFTNLNAQQQPLNEVKGAIILSENSSIAIIGKKTGFISFIITKKLKIKILNENGVKRFSTIKLPELFDPTYFDHSTEARNIGNYYYSNYTMEFFRAKLNSNTEYSPKASKKEIQSVFIQNKYNSLFVSEYEIDNIHSGDTLELAYEYSIPFKDNPNTLTSIRVFFNSDLYKEQFNLTLSHPINLITNVGSFNNANPDSVSENKQQKQYFWKRNQLAGCIDEPNSRPYLSLPYFVLSIKPKEYMYTLPYSYEEKFIPSYVMAIYGREASHLNILRSVDQGVKTSQFLQIDKFIASKTEGITNDSLNLQKLKNIHNAITNEFAFANDTDVFKGIDIRDERIGDYLSAQTLRDISRYTTYVALISKIGLNYFTAYLMDKRIGELSETFISPMFDGDYLIAPFLKNGKVHFIYPKKSKFGYYLDELPFYFENTKTQLINVDDYLDYKKPMKEQFRTIKTLSSSVANNSRKSNVMVDVDIENLTTKFDAKILLLGQYSTLTRGLYKSNFIEPSINKKYGQKIWEIDNNAKLIKQEIVSEEKEFPFKTSIKAQYSCNNIVKKEGVVYSISLNNWFNHIICPNFSDKRYLDFYPDFCGTDTYSYLIQFAKNVKLKQEFQKIEVKNSFGNLVVSIDQPQPNTIRITSYLGVVSEQVSANKANEVKEIFDTIQNLNAKLLEFTIVE